MKNSLILFTSDKYENRQMLVKNRKKAENFTCFFKKNKKICETGKN